MFLLFSIFFLIKINSYDCLIIIPFNSEKKINDYEYFNSTSFLECIKSSSKTIIELGEPCQKLNAFLSSSIFAFEISDTNFNNELIYNYSQSSSFINLTNPNINQSSIYKKSYAKENFYFYTDIELKNKKKFEKMQVLLVKNIVKKSYYNKAVIGLQIGDIFQDKNTNNLIREMKELNYIDNYAWTFNFNKNNFFDNLLIIGGYPHEYDENYKKEYLHSILSDDGKYWGLNFTKIKSGNETFENSTLALFKFENNVIFGPISYKKMVLDNFFKYYIENNICFCDENNYNVYSCNKTLFTIEDINKFPKLQFNKNSLNYTFEFNGKDLFLEKGDYYFFMIPTTNVFWEFGKLFLNKYQLIFDHDTKMISLYTEYKNENEKIVESSFFYKNYKLFLVCAIFLLASLIIIIGIIIWKKIYKKSRKVRTNELDDDFDYMQQSNELDNENLNINPS